MRINATDSVPSPAPEPQGSHRGSTPRSKPPVDEMVHHPTPVPTDTTNVVVEMQKDNTVVYKIIDAANGQLIQQIPSQQMINFSKAIAEELSALSKPEGRK